MNSQPRPAVLVGSVLVIATCVALASVGVTALFASALLTKLSGAVLVLVPGLTGVLQYCGTFRHSHDAALLASTCLTLLIVPSFLLSVTILAAGVIEPAVRSLLFASGGGLLGLALGGGWMLIANLHRASVLEDASLDQPMVRTHPLRIASEVVGFTLIVAVIGAVAAMCETSPLVELLSVMGSRRF